MAVFGSKLKVASWSSSPSSSPSLGLTLVRSISTTVSASMGSRSNPMTSTTQNLKTHLVQQKQQQQQPCRWMGTWPKVRPKRIRMITMDVTGTIVSFRGSLEEHYLGAAKKCGVELDTNHTLNFNDAFHQAYQETCELYPCFGGNSLTAKQWWRECVSKSFRLAGCQMDDITEDMVFNRIYSTFGSNAAYEVFPDALPFLEWAKRKHLICGVLSNADERYGDSILPMLGLTHDELQFRCFSKELMLEKPDGRVFMAAIAHGQPFLNFLDDQPCQPSEVLHIGNDFRKDFEGARRAGMHAVLLERYENQELASEWRRRGAQVFTDLLDVVEFIGRSNCQLG